MSDKVKVHVPQESGQITQTGNGESRRWIVKDHIVEVKEADLNRVLSGVSGSTVVDVGRDTPAEAKPADATTEKDTAKDGSSNPERSSKR